MRRFRLRLPLVETCRLFVEIKLVLVARTLDLA